MTAALLTALSKANLPCGAITWIEKEIRAARLAGIREVYEFLKAEGMAGCIFADVHVYQRFIEAWEGEPERLEEQMAKRKKRLAAELERERARAAGGAQ